MMMIFASVPCVPRLQVCLLTPLQSLSSEDLHKIRPRFPASVRGATDLSSKVTLFKEPRTFFINCKKVQSA